ncbi:hypothetical protein DY000_02016279 [Brassica cretica]|uniref:Uncharacterized protein n=1 Tax=Brassica cretica TaxID=69181 RepID=A0ABQ7DAV6_BRACR|nr:hypothetical protein DY000_02016279 [Brassica cretica]
MCFSEHGGTLLMSWRSWPEPHVDEDGLLGAKPFLHGSKIDPKTKAGGRTLEAGGKNPKPEQEPRSWSRNPEDGAGTNMVFFIGLRELHRSIKFLIEFGVGRRLVAWAIKLPYEMLPPWLGLVGVGRKLDGEVGNVCIKGDASSHTPDTCAASVAILGLRILRGRILARLGIRGMRRFNKTRRTKLRILMLDSAGLACASWACKSWGTFGMFFLVPGDNLVDSWYRSRSLGHVVCGEQ